MKIIKKRRYFLVDDSGRIIQALTKDDYKKTEGTIIYDGKVYVDSIDFDASNPRKFFEEATNYSLETLDGCIDISKENSCINVDLLPGAKIERFIFNRLNIKEDEEVLDDEGKRHTWNKCYIERIKMDTSKQRMDIFLCGHEEQEVREETGSHYNDSWEPVTDYKEYTIPKSFTCRIERSMYADDFWELLDLSEYRASIDLKIDDEIINFCNKTADIVRSMTDSNQFDYELYKTYVDVQWADEKIYTGYDDGNERIMLIRECKKVIDPSHIEEKYDVKNKVKIREWEEIVKKKSPIVVSGVKNLHKKTIRMEENCYLVTMKPESK